jgi:hypothetical protein
VPVFRYQSVINFDNLCCILIDASDVIGFNVKVTIKGFICAVHIEKFT